ncbi:hypothetical protein C4J85_3691 [Pseudomonas sp. R4-34-07]|nr:hypothetical protein C4J88_3678 [Pseudomonas sp. R4-39-08]AZF54159.1 hypothetical protein C4J85_3691 [Pseudomonas sp. R4-34-07]
MWEGACPNASQLRTNTVPVARELAPAGPRSGPKNGTAAQSSGSKLPRHRLLFTLSTS